MQQPPVGKRGGREYMNAHECCATGGGREEGARAGGARTSMLYSCTRSLSSIVWMISTAIGTNSSYETLPSES